MSLRKCLCTIAACFAFTFSTFAAQEAGIQKLHIVSEDGAFRVYAQDVNGEDYIFLPPNVPPTKVKLYFEDSGNITAEGEKGSAGISSGGLIDLIALCGEKDVYSVTLNSEKGEEKINFVPAGNTASMFITSSDPENHGREWVEASDDKSNKAEGSLLMTDAEGNVLYNGKLKQIKGRGNSTWGYEKKPYQIKLSDATELLATGDEANAAKTWVLLANARDPSLLRDRIVYDLSVEMNMEPGIECRPVSLYYDGEYRGAYLLCEKVEVNHGRVDISDLEKATEEANPDTDLGSLEVKEGRTP